MILVIARQFKNVRGLPLHLARDADVIVGRDYKVLKDRHGEEGERISEQRLNELREEATEVIEP